MTDLTLLDQVLHDTSDVLDRHARVYPVLIVEVDVIGAQPSKGGFRRLANVIGAAVHRRLAFHRWQVEPKLSGDDHLVAHRREGLAHEFLIHERAIDLGRVEKGPSLVEGGSDHADALPPFHAWSINLR